MLRTYPPAESRGPQANDGVPSRTRDSVCDGVGRCRNSTQRQPESFGYLQVEQANEQRVSSGVLLPSFVKRVHDGAIVYIHDYLRST